MFPYFPHWPSQSEGQWGKRSLYWPLMQEKHKFGDSQRDSCKDMTHIDLEIPHYLKGYVVVEALLPTSAYWNNQRKGKLNATLLRIQAESAVEIQGASVSHRSPEQPPKAGGLQPDRSWQFCQYPIHLHAYGALRCLLNENKYFGHWKLGMTRESTVCEEKNEEGSGHWESISHLTRHNKLSPHLAA